MSADEAPPISVVVATTHAGPVLAACVERLRPQLSRIGGQLVLADGSDAEDAVTPAIGRGATVLRAPGADVFRLRELGARAAAGAVVAFTEDHCLPAPDWCAAMVSAHAEHPTTAAVSGVTRNGSPHALVDRANFLTTFAPMLPPAPAEPSRVPPPNNVGIKAVSLAEYELRPGLLELEILPHLVGVGHLVVDDRVVVDHVQSHGRIGSVLVHFHNGRATTGLRELPSPRDRARRMLESVALVPIHLRATWREVARRPGERRAALPALPWVAALLCAHAAGQVVGVLAGPGTSPRALE